jgi:exoribonuclease R
MNKAVIMISDREYSGWKFVDANRIECVLPSTFNQSFNPLTQRLFTRDTIDTATGNVIYSSVRNGQAIAGVLMLDGNRSYGRTENKKRLLYRCVPDDKYLPVFLVPYEIKLGFEKNTHNKYVVFQFDAWTDAHKHPYGLLSEVLGDVGDLGAFYEYQLHCRSLNVPMTTFNNSVKKAVCNSDCESIRNTREYGILPPNNTAHIFTIDPSGSLDFDDAFSVVSAGSGEYDITVYIANVYVWLDKLGLWQSFSKRVSTIYLPDRRRPMLPTVLSDNLCSLVADKTRFAFAMTVRYSAQTQTVDWKTARFDNREVTVAKNYVYDSADMEADPDYRILFGITRTLVGDIKDSHDTVAWWMVQMNRECGERLYRERKGVFRTLKLLNRETNSKEPVATDMSAEAKMCIKNWRNTSGQYCTYDDICKSGCNGGHELLGVEHYAQITSPIRRLVDLLNQMMFMSMSIDMSMSAEATAFMEGWLAQMEYVNVAMRSIRKVQTDCDILCKCTQNPAWKDAELDGIVFDGVQRSDGTYSYMVFLESPRILSRVYSTEKWEEHEKRKFRIFLFDDETKLCTKVRVGCSV